MRSVGQHARSSDDNFDGLSRNVTVSYGGKEALANAQHGKILQVYADGQFHGRDWLIRELRNYRTDVRVGKKDIDLLKVYVCTLNEIVRNLAGTNAFESVWGAGYVGGFQ